MALITSLSTVSSCFSRSTVEDAAELPAIFQVIRNILGYFPLSEGKAKKGNPNAF